MKNLHCDEYTHEYDDGIVIEDDDVIVIDDDEGALKVEEDVMGVIGDLLGRRIETRQDDDDIEIVLHLRGLAPRPSYSVEFSQIKDLGEL